MNKPNNLNLYLVPFFMGLGLANALADAVSVAVAANFTDTAKEIARTFKERRIQSARLADNCAAQARLATLKIQIACRSVV